MWADDPSLASRAFDERGNDEGAPPPPLDRMDEIGDSFTPRDLTPFQSATSFPPPPREVSQHIHLHSFRANPFSVRDALHAAQGRIERLLRAEDAWALELVLAEIMNNIVEHGYANSGEGTISLALALQGDELICTIGDFGPALPQNCLYGAIQPPEPSDLPDGGFGWFLIRDLAQNLHYDREEGRNWLTLRFPLAKPQNSI
ncbi:MAG TPA: ATP-binding protein [Paenirhodobacter sp.]